MFSVLIPTWNNLDYLKLCLEGLRKHSVFDHEILVHINEGSDGTLNWIRDQGVRYTSSQNNIGVCLAVNRLAGLANNDWIVYLNDDMVCCPGWDEAVLSVISKADNDLAFYSSRLIEPTNTGNKDVLVGDCGQSPDNFDWDKLLRTYSDDASSELLDGASQPTIVSRKWWHMVGGYSVEFSPGMASDIDLLMKFWVAGCRTFRIVDSSRVYHFACRSTGRIKKNRGGRQFVMKWGLTEAEFKKNYLSKCSAFGLTPDTFPEASPLGRLKRMIYGLGCNFPLEDLKSWSPFNDSSPSK